MRITSMQSGMVCLDGRVHVVFVSTNSFRWSESERRMLGRELQIHRVFVCNGSCAGKAFDVWNAHHIQTLFKLGTRAECVFGSGEVVVHAELEEVTSAAVQYTLRTGDESECSVGSQVVMGRESYYTILQSPIHDHIRNQPILEHLQSAPMLEPDAIGQILSTRLGHPIDTEPLRDRVRVVGWGRYPGGFGYPVYIFENPNEDPLHPDGVFWWVNPVQVPQEEFDAILREAWWEPRGSVHNAVPGNGITRVMVARIGAFHVSHMWGNALEYWRIYPGGC